MIIEKYGIQLKKITIADIELIRSKRNAESISSKMIFKTFISAEQQIIWFKSINNFNNFYYLIYIDNQPIGLINDKNIDWNKFTSEAGLFIWEEKYLKTIVPALATMMLMELGFEILSWKKTSINILASNKEALTYNKQVGFKITDKNKEIVTMELTRESYHKKARKIIIALTKNQREKSLILKITPEDKDIIDKIVGLIITHHIPVIKETVNDAVIFKYRIIA